MGTPIRKKLGREESGLTLVELLVVVLILGIVGAIGVTGLVRSMETTRYSGDRADALQAAQVAMERVSRELRAADPLRHAESTFVTLDVRRKDSAGEERLYHYRYEVTGPADGPWDLEEEYWRFDDPTVFDAPGFVPSQGAAQEVRTAVLASDLSEENVFEILDGNGDPLDEPDPEVAADQTRQVRITVERVVSDGARPIEVTTIVKVRNA